MITALSDPEWDFLLRYLRVFGLEIVGFDKAAGTVTVRVPPLEP